MKPSLPILYSFRRCPYAMRARLAIAVSQETVELREVVLRDKPEALISASPKATVPVLVLQDRTVIDESIEIMQWSLQQNDPEKWLQYNNTKLIETNDQIFKQHLDRYKYFQRHPEKTQEEHRSEGELFLNKLEELLSKNEFLTSRSFGITDAAILPFVRQFAHVDKDWFETSPYSKTRTWLNNFEGSQRFMRIMHKYPQWHAGDTPTQFPPSN